MNRSNACPEISIEEAVEMIVNGKELVRNEISDLRELINELGKYAKQYDEDESKYVLCCRQCLIRSADCDGLEIKMKLKFSAFSDVGEYVVPNCFVDASFCGVCFSGDVNFGYSIFNGPVCFEDADFKGKANFFHVEFVEEAWFSRAEFSGNAEFGEATFSKDALFQDAVFKESVIFKQATFGGKTAFEDIEFPNDTFFDECNINGYMSFNGATLGVVGFQKSRISGELRLSKAEFRDKATIDLFRIDLAWNGKIEMHSDQLMGRCGVGLLLSEQSGKHYSCGYAADQYNILRDNFRRQPNREEEEDLCHYRYKDLKRRAIAPPPCKKLWQSLMYWLSRGGDYFFFKLCWGYGVRVKNIIFTMLVVILLCSVIYLFNPEQWRAKSECVGGRIGEASYFSVVTFTTIGYGDYAPLGWLRGIAAAEGLLGLFLMAVFTVSFARKIIR